jgi:hypothetical protein
MTGREEVETAQRSAEMKQFDKVTQPAHISFIGEMRK